MKVNVGPLKADLENTGRSAAEALAEIDRELNLRIRMYGDWIKSRKLSALDAKDRLERLARAAQIVAASQEMDDEKRIQEAAIEAPSQDDSLSADFERKLQGEGKAGIVP